MASRTLRGQRPKKPHLIRGRGVNGEVLDLRNDVSSAIARLESEAVIDLTFYFTDVTAPAPGTHPGKYGICHSGPIPLPGEAVLFPQGSIWYDDGVQLINVTVQGLVVSPRIDVVGQVSMDANGLYQATVASAPYGWTGKGGSGGGSAPVPIVVWSTQTWDEVYEQIALFPACVVLVPPSSVNRIMTPPPGGAALTDLSNVLFVGLRSADGAGAGLNFGCPIVEIDPGGTTGGVSLAHHRLRSKDINWIAYYRITGIDNENPYIEFDGGSFHQAAGPALTRHNIVTLVLRNGAAVTAHAGAAGLLAMAAHVTIVATNGSSLGARTAQFSVLPQQLDLITDSSVVEDPGAFIGALSIQRTRWDAAGGVSYDDTLALPPLHAVTVQEAVDVLKGLPSGHVVQDHGAAMPQRPNLYVRGLYVEDEPVDDHTLVQFPVQLTTADRIAYLRTFPGCTVYDTDLQQLMVHDGTAWRTA